MSDIHNFRQVIYIDDSYRHATDKYPLQNVGVCVNRHVGVNTSINKEIGNITFYDNNNTHLVLLSKGRYCSCFSLLN